VAKFVKGQSGNPGGRPKVIQSVRDLARQETEACIRALAEIRDSKRAPAAARVAAIRELLDRAYGRAAQPLGQASELSPVRFIIDGLDVTHAPAKLEQ
jgi:hypothetical protein